MAGKRSGWSVGGDTPEDEARDAKAPPLSAEALAEYEELSKQVPPWDPDSHIGPVKAERERGAEEFI